MANFITTIIKKTLPEPAAKSAIAAFATATAARTLAKQKEGAATAADTEAAIQRALTARQEVTATGYSPDVSWQSIRDALKTGTASSVVVEAVPEAMPASAAIPASSQPVVQAGMGSGSWLLIGVFVIGAGAVAYFKFGRKKGIRRKRRR